MRPGNFGDLSDTWFGEFSGRGRRRRGLRRRRRGGAKRRAFRAKARAAGWNKAARRAKRQAGLGPGPCAGLRGWKKWRCRWRQQ